MNILELKSMDVNVTAFCKKLTNAELAEVTDYVVYHSTDTSIKLSQLCIEFIHEFFGEKDWKDNLDDEINKPEFFTKCTRNTQEIIRLVRIGLLQECFFRFINKTKEPVAAERKPFVSREEGAKLHISHVSEHKLSPSDRKALKEILNEHHAMLTYQLEDEKGVIDAGGEELVAEKKRHKKFIERFGK